MKIETNKIPFDGGLEINWILSAGELDLNTDEIKFVSPVRIDIYAQKGYNNVNLKVNLFSKVEVICARCLKEFFQDIKKEFSLDFVLEKNQVSLNIDNDIREELIIDYPMKALCSFDCKGLCKTCGKDLNLGICNCSKK
jgi:uncharacterized protein